MYTKLITMTNEFNSGSDCPYNSTRKTWFKMKISRRNMLHEIMFSQNTVLCISRKTFDKTF